MGSQRGGGGGGGGGSLFFANSTSANLLGPPWGAEQPSGRLRSRKLVKGETLFPWSVGFQRAEREGLATAGLGTATPGAALRAAGRAPSSRRAGRGRSAAVFRGSLRSSALCPVGTAPNGSAGGGASSADERVTLSDGAPRATVHQTGTLSYPAQGTGAAKSLSDVRAQRGHGSWALMALLNAPSTLSFGVTLAWRVIGDQRDARVVLVSREPGPSPGSPAPPRCVPGPRDPGRRGRAGSEAGALSATRFPGSAVDAGVFLLICVFPWLLKGN